MAYTTIDKPSDYFNTILWTGNDTDNRIISTVGFAPNWSWIKARNNSDQHYLVDTVRGSTKVIFSDSSSSEQTRVSAVKAFYQEGYILGQEAQVNRNGGTFVSWNWKETADAGFDIVSYTGNGSGRTISHSLSAVPKFMILKNRDADGRNWPVYFGDQTKYMYLSSTDGQANAGTIIWNNTAPTSSVFSVGDDNGVNQNGEKYIAYLFAEKQGYSKFDSYVGNGSDTPNGVFVYLGFKPAYILIKATDSNSWVIVDNKRPADSNPVDSSLAADSTATETTGDSNTTFDFLSNGFRTNGNSGNNNSSGQKYIYMAFAEQPFVTSTGVPATAR